MSRRQSVPQSRTPDPQNPSRATFAVAGYFHANTIGFSDLFIKELVRDQNFPKYSIYNSKVPPFNTIIEVALAGYSPNDISVSWDSFSLRIASRQQGEIPSREEPNDDGRTYQHNGIAKRHFQLRFLLAPGVSDVTAHFRQGILTVEIEVTAELTPANEVQIADVPAASKLKMKRDKEKDKDTLRVLAGIKPIDEKVLAESTRRNLYGDRFSGVKADPADGLGPAPWAHGSADDVEFEVDEDRPHAPLTEGFSNNGSFTFNAGSDQPVSDQKAKES